MVAEVGARFKGYNRHGKHKWSTTCTVTESAPGKLFSFSAQPKGAKTQSLWRYEPETTSGGTRVRESFQVLWWTKPLMLVKFGGREPRLTQLQEGLQQSLEQFKAIAETPLPAVATGVHAGYESVS